MSISKRTAAQAAAWTAVGVIGLGAVGELANARPTTSAPAVTLAQATGPTGATGDTGDKGDKGAKADGRRGPGRHHGRGPGKGMHRGRVLHGEATVKAQDGTFTVVVTQVGEVTAASATSITVRSEDGYSSTWVLTFATEVREGREEAEIGDIDVGDTVHVRGEKTSSGVTTKHVGIKPAEANQPSS